MLITYIYLNIKCKPIDIIYSYKSEKGKNVELFDKVLPHTTTHELYIDISQVMFHSMRHTGWKH